jgi:hypothetical protein
MRRRLAAALALAAFALGACGPVKNLDPLGALAGPVDSSRYGFETSTQGWAPSVSQGGSCVGVSQAQGRSFYGHGSLGFDVAGMDNLNNGADSARVSIVFGAGGVTLTGKSLSLWVYAPANVEPSDSAPSNASIFILDSSGNYANGRSFNLAAGNWTHLTYAPQANPGASPISDTNTGLYVGAGFNPALVKELGLKVGTAGTATNFSYTGVLLLDAVNW